MNPAWLLMDLPGRTNCVDLAMPKGVLDLAYRRRASDSPSHSLTLREGQSSGARARRVSL